MKATRLKNLFLSNAPLAIISLLLGYSFWYIASYNHVITLQFNVPLCFSNVPEHYAIEAPEKIAITIRGQRSDIYSLEKKALAAHINLQKFLPGKHGIIVTEQHLFLPKNIVLAHYKPSNLSISIHEKRYRIS